MFRSKKLAAAIGALALTGGFAFFGTSPAQAADSTPFPRCAGGNFCIWESADGGVSYRASYSGDAEWPVSWINDDYGWANNGWVEPGADHVRVYDAGPNPDVRTLCIHQGHSALASSNDAAWNARAKGNWHRWGGECGSGEPQF